MYLRYIRNVWCHTCYMYLTYAMFRCHTCTCTQYTHCVMSYMYGTYMYPKFTLFDIIHVYVPTMHILWGHAHTCTCTWYMQCLTPYKSIYLRYAKFDAIQRHLPQIRNIWSDPSWPMHSSAFEGTSRETELGGLWLEKSVFVYLWFLQRFVTEHRKSI